MSWTLIWGPVARRDLRTIPWQIAASVDRAVMQFAASGRGAERVSAEHDRRVRVRVPGAVAYLLLEPAERVVHVTRIYRRG